MSKGKVCISICANTADELLKRIGQAKPLADLIEVRFDCFQPSEIKLALARISDEPELSEYLLATFRPLEQGGFREVSLAERQQFWTSGINKVFWGGDFEKDVIDLSVSANWKNRICSVHEGETDRLDVESIYEELKATDASVIKIAVAADDATDAIPIWKLLKKAKSENKPVIPVAMGEGGRWVRILGPAHGSFMTYSSLETGSETALGQISAEDLVNVFRVKELDEETEVYGIIAGDTSYSVSPWMHNAAFKEMGMNRVFLPLQTNDLDEFMRLMVDETREVELNFRGFSVTNPHKRSIIEHLHSIDETATNIGAVNTIKIESGKLFGFNTDAPGFIAPLKKVLGDVKGARVAIAGAGGAARACVYALKQEGANVTIFARKHRRAEKLAEEFGVNVGNSNNSFRPGTVDILVNATPLGTKGGETEATIATASQMSGIKLVYDLVYNPIQTRLIREARIAGVAALGGLDMVLAQGRKQFEIWAGENAPTNVMAAAIKRKLV
ncbi:MAG TPA: shikimate dehydrogenase [Pyrinomonadaceae bacterium]|nr:shikimate dehydrogenase [Pyrinomonadaceae bacterium]